MGRGTSKAAKQKPTNARRIEDMNEAQIDQEIEKNKRFIERAEKKMQENGETAQERAMREMFPLGVGGSGWSASAKRRRDRETERSVKRAKNYTDAYTSKQDAENDIKRLQAAKKYVHGTNKTTSQINQEKWNSTKMTLKWKTTQKEEFTGSSYKPKIIKAGNYEIHGKSGYYSIYSNGKQIGGTNKLSDAKIFVERHNKRSK